MRTGTGSPKVTIGGAGVLPNLVVVNSNTRNYTFESTSGATLGGTAQLVKNGTSTLTLSGPATYGGGTVVNAGSLWMGSNDSIPDFGPVAIASGATLDTRGNNDTVGDLTVNGAVRGPTGSLTMDSLVLGSNAIFEPRLVLKGNLTKLSGGATTLANTISLGAGAGTFTVGAGTVAPELTITGLFLAAI
jgi:autotransporter-associated beta strand protein